MEEDGTCVKRRRLEWWFAYQRTWMQNNYYNFHLNILKNNKI
jgi:hypothetical protein